MVGWRHLFDGREFEQAPGVGDGQGSLLSSGFRGLPVSAGLQFMGSQRATARHD